jgi:K+/H+ antiporter YhaU regulatory subunit KhtT
MNVVVVGIQHVHGRMEFNPVASTMLHGGDHLIVLGSSQTLKQLEEAAK